MGNRLTRVLNGATSTYTMATASNRLSAVAGVSRTYDLAGNQIGNGSATFNYDDRGRMSGAVTPLGTVSFGVNALGQRVRKTAGTVTTYFAYDLEGRLIGEYSGTGQPVQEVSWIGDTPVATIRPNGTSFDVFFVWSDHLNTPRLVTNAAGQPRWNWPNIDPFGANLPNENPSSLGAFTFGMRFPGQYFDMETQTHYNYFRDFDPSIGRYVQSDPIGLEGGINTYAYGGGSPLVNVDPEGLAYFCMYAQSLGTFSCFDNDGKGKQVIDDSKCYAGKGKHKNNPQDQCVKDQGPLPRGWYDIGQGYTHKKLGPLTFNLDPQPGTNMCTPLRNVMRVHGDSSSHPGSASDGCIVCGKKTRDQLQRGGGGTLLVTQ